MEAPEVLMVAAVSCLMLGLAPGMAGAQNCSLDGGGQFGPGIKVTAQTYILGTCADQQVGSRAWLEGWPSYVSCINGSTYIGGGKCERIWGPGAHGGGEAIATLSGTSFCGAWRGRTEHWALHVPTGQIWGQQITPPSNLMYGPPCYRAEECQDWEIWDEQTQRCVPYNSPILVPLTRSQDYHLTSVHEGVMFDMDGNGVKEQTAWTARNSRLAFLAIDVDNDGLITSGRELVGDRMVDGKHNGFSALLALAPSDTAALTEEHELFHRLLLWEDRNHDGVSQKDELQPASNVVSEIGLGYVPHNRRDRHGNKFMFEGWASVRSAPGRNPTTSHQNMVERNIKLYDVFFKAQ